MDDRDERPRDERSQPADQPEQEPYTPATFEKRAAAWMAIGYMLMLLFVVTFAIFTGGKRLPGTFPLLLVPVSVYAAVVAVHRTRAGMIRLPLTVLAVLLCAAAAALGLFLGVPALVNALRTAYQ